MSEIPEWMVDPRSNAPLDEKTLRKARKSIYYDRFASIIDSVPVMRTRKQGWKMLSTIHQQMDMLFGWQPEGMAGLLCAVPFHKCYKYLSCTTNRA